MAKVGCAARLRCNDGLHYREPGPLAHSDALTHRQEDEEMFKASQASRPRALMVVLVAALVMVLAARASGAIAQTAGTQTVSGILSVIEGDPIGFSGPHQLKTYVVDEQDRTRWTPVTLSQTQIQQAGG